MMYSPQVKENLISVTESLQAEGDRLCMQTDMDSPR